MTQENRARLQEILKDKYDVEDMIYRGGMGEIYLGFHRQLNAKVAIKIMIQKLTDNPDLKKRFHKEARLYANLRHPNIIHIYDFGTEDAFDYMVFPFIDGETLQDLMNRETRLDVKTCLNIMIAVARALSYAAENNVIHRDVKPSNIMIEKNGNVLITDFGVSKDLKDVDMTLPGTMLGSPKYMSPDQILGKEVDSRSDQYPLGLIFFEMITGGFPFAMNNANALFYSHVQEELKFPEDKTGRIPPDIKAIIRRLTAKNPEDRYPDFNALIKELTRIQIDQTIVATRRDGAKKIGKTSGTGRGRTALTAGLIAVLLIAGAAGALFYRSSVTYDIPQTAAPGPAPKESIAETPAPSDEIEAPGPRVPEPAPPPPPTVASIRNTLFNFGIPDNQALFQISVNKPAFRIGDEIVYTITARRDCHVVLLDFSTSDELVQLFPNRFHPDSFIRADTVYQVPDRGSFEVTGPTGAETVIGFAGPVPFEFFTARFDDQPFLMFNNDDIKSLETLHAAVKTRLPKDLVRKNIDFVISE